MSMKIYCKIESGSSGAFEKDASYHTRILLRELLIEGFSREVHVRNFIWYRLNLPVARLSTASTEEWNR